MVLKGGACGRVGFRSGFLTEGFLLFLFDEGGLGLGWAGGWGLGAGGWGLGPGAWGWDGGAGAVGALGLAVDGCAQLGAGLDLFPHIW